MNRVILSLLATGLFLVGNSAEAQLFSRLCGKKNDCCQPSTTCCKPACPPVCRPVCAPVCRPVCAPVCAPQPVCYNPAPVCAPQPVCYNPAPVCAPVTTCCRPVCQPVCRPACPPVCRPTCAPVCKPQRVRLLDRLCRSRHNDCCS